MLAITIDMHGEVPVYRQIADEIRTLIARRALEDGATLPSVRRLGHNIGVNQNTVAKAYRILADEGLIHLRHGAPAHVTSVRGYREAPADEGERRLHDLVSRWVLAGRSRDELEHAFAQALDQYFGETS